MEKQNNLTFAINIKNICVETALTLDWHHVDHSLKPSNKITKLVWTLYLQQTDQCLKPIICITPILCGH